MRHARDGLARRERIRQPHAFDPREIGLDVRPRGAHLGAGIGLGAGTPEQLRGPSLDQDFQVLAYPGKRVVVVTGLQQRGQLRFDLGRRRLPGLELRARVGQTLDVLVEGVSDESEFLLQGRHPGQAPDVDGVVLLTKNLAIDYGRLGIRVNAICPGFIDTPMFRSVMGTEHMAEYREEYREHHKLGRFGRPEEVAAAAAFLLSDDGEWVNGQVWSVNGGHVLR